MAEVMVVVAILAALVSVLGTLNSMGTKSFQRSSNRSEALHGAYLLFQQLRNDLQMIVYDENHPLSITGSGSGSASSLTFRVYSREDSTDDRIATQKVEYVFDPETLRVTRNGKVATVGYFESVEFVLEEPDWTTNPPTFGNQVLCVIKGLGSNAAKSFKKETQGVDPGQDRVTFIGGFHLGYKFEREQFPTWIMNGTSYPQ